MKEGKPHYIAVGTLIVILILSAVILNLSKPSDLNPVVNTDVETEEVIVAEMPVPGFEDVPEVIVGGDKDEHGCIGSAGYSWCEEKQKCLRFWEESCSGCDPIKFDVFCDTQHNLFLCENINDGNLSSEWFAGYSCNSDKAPCVVNNNVIINAEEPFKYIKVYNRLSPDFYINRVLIDYNEYKKVTFTGGQKFTQTPWTIELLEPTQEAKINIVEIMGVGYRYQAGLSEIELYDCKQ